MINDRINELIKCFADGNKRRFSQITDLAPSVIENLVGTRKGKPSFDVLEKIILAFADISTDWLITGRGEMLLSDKKNDYRNDYRNDYQDTLNKEKSISESISEASKNDEKNTNLNTNLNKKNAQVNAQVDSKNDKKNGAESTPIIYGNRISDTAVPFYDLPVSAGPLGIIELGNERTEAGYIDIPIFRGCERVLPVMGVSMEPVIFSGDLVGIRTIPNLSERWDFLQTGKVYLIITREDRMIKYLQESADNKDYIVCYSPNCSPFKVFKGDILQLFRVVAVARGLN